MRYFLIGFMGSGKTTFGKHLAEYLKIEFYDLDHYIESKTNKKIINIFSLEGEQSFREYETFYLKEIINNHTNAVISTGGGTPCFHNNIQLMLKSGLVIYLKQNPEILVYRILNSKTARPLIDTVDKNKILDWVTKKLAEREHYYNQANIIINVQNITPSVFIEYIKQLGYN